MRDQERDMRDGVHMVVATPGRLLEVLKKRIITLDICKYFVMDEADRLVDMGFEEEVRAPASVRPRPLFSSRVDDDILTDQRHHRLLQRTEADRPLLGDHADQDPAVCADGVGQTDHGERGEGGGRQHGRHPRDRIRQTRSQDRLSVGLSSEDAATGEFQMTRRRWLTTWCLGVGIL